MRLLPSVLIVVAGICAVTGAALANVLDVPITEEASDGQMSNCMSSVVTGLAADGGGFLAVRTGPGSSYREIDKLRNGDVVIIFEMRGDWAGVVYRTPDVRCASTTTRPVTYRNKGWNHSRWLQDLAG